MICKYTQTCTCRKSSHTTSYFSSGTALSWFSAGSGVQEYRDMYSFIQCRRLPNVSMYMPVCVFKIFSETTEPRREKTGFCICENKDADQLRGNRKADQRLCFFATRIVESLYFLNPKFQASSHLLWLYRPVCVGLGRNPRRPVFSQRGSNALKHKLRARGSTSKDAAGTETVKTLIRKLLNEQSDLGLLQNCLSKNVGSLRQDNPP